MQIQNQIGRLKTHNFDKVLMKLIQNRQVFGRYTQKDVDFSSDLLHGGLHGPPSHQFCQNVSTFGFDFLSESNCSPDDLHLDPYTIQTCHILVQHFLSQLKQQGESTLVQQFVKSVVQHQESPQNSNAFTEIHKSLSSTLNCVLEANGIS